MNDHAPPDLVAPVDDLRLSAENLAEDLVDGLGRISADRAARAPARVRVHPADVSTVERVRVVEEEVDLLEFFLLHVQDGVRELADLASVVPVAMTDDDPFDVIGIESDRPHLLANWGPAARGVQVEDVVQLLPAGVVEPELSIRPFDDADVHREIHGGPVAAIG